MPQISDMRVFNIRLATFYFNITNPGSAGCVWGTLERGLLGNSKHQAYSCCFNLSCCHGGWLVHLSEEEQCHTGYRAGLSLCIWLSIGFFIIAHGLYWKATFLCVSIQVSTPSTFLLFQFRHLAPWLRGALVFFERFNLQTMYFLTYCFDGSSFLKFYKLTEPYNPRITFLTLEAWSLLSL